MNEVKSKERHNRRFATELVMILGGWTQRNGRRGEVSLSVFLGVPGECLLRLGVWDIAMNRRRELRRERCLRSTGDGTAGFGVAEGEVKICS